MTNEIAAKPRGHLFQKGQSGNPAGRPKGSKNQISILKIQVEGELRAQMKDNMSAVVAEMIRQALPQTVTDKDGKEKIIAGDGDMLRTLYKSWVTGTKASDDETPKDKIVIQIGKLEDKQTTVIDGNSFTETKE